MPEPIQEGTVSDGHGHVIWVETLADPSAPTPAEVNGGVLITYGLTADGYALTATHNKVSITRYTLKQILRKNGTVEYEVVTTYVYNRQTPTEVEKILGVPGKRGYLLHSLGYENEHVFVNGDKINDVVPIEVTESSDVAPTANSELAKTMTPNITGTVGIEVTVGGDAS